MDRLVVASKEVVVELVSDEYSDEYPLIQKLNALVQSTRSPFSENFKNHVGRLADISSEYQLFDTESEKRALLSLFEAEEFLLAIEDSHSATDLALFELNESERTLLLSKCQQMRKIVWALETFDEPHRNRLLQRIASIEHEVGKDKGLYDVVLGGISDFGEALGKFGVDVKPLTDRIQEVASVARRRTPEYDKLPAPEKVKRLPSPDSEEQD